jgi:predicted TIM-barrel fold metal-dependent hydrolase
MLTKSQRKAMLGSAEARWRARIPASALGGLFMVDTDGGSTENVLIFSGDGHMGADIDTYKDYIDPRYLDRFDGLHAENDFYINVAAKPRYPTPHTMEIIDGRGSIRAGGEYGVWDMDIRLRELDAEGIAGEVVHYAHQCSTSPFFSPSNKAYPPDVRAAGAQAYHRWAGDFMAKSGGRLVGVAEPGPCLDLEATERELRWVADHGFVSVMLPGATADATLPPLQDPYYERFWAVAEELGLVLSVHAGWGLEQGAFFKLFESINKAMGGAAGVDGSAGHDFDKLAEALDKSDESPLRLDLGPRRAMWQLMIGGVFDRHPNLRLALTEVRADWVPKTIAHLEELHAAGNFPTELTPTEYYQRNIFATPSSIHRSEVEMRHEIGLDKLLFGVDYPHWEGIWPNTADWIRTAFAGVPEADARKILGENAIAAYGLDRATFAEVAARIGPKAADVFGDHVVAPALVEEFHKRSGFSRPADPVDLTEIDTVVRQDVGLVAAAHH